MVASERRPSASLIAKTIVKLMKSDGDWLAAAVQTHRVFDDNGSKANPQLFFFDAVH